MGGDMCKGCKGGGGGWDVPRGGMMWARGIAMFDVVEVWLQFGTVLL